MRYLVRSLAMTGGSQTWRFDDKHEAMCKVRELKDAGGMFLVRVIELEPTK
jgi:hypothetical protein